MGPIAENLHKREGKTGVISYVVITMIEGYIYIVGSSKERQERKERNNCVVLYRVRPHSETFAGPSWSPGRPPTLGDWDVLGPDCRKPTQKKS